jgi:hypothetical protein
MSGTPRHGGVVDTRYVMKNFRGERASIVSL